MIIPTTRAFVSLGPTCIPAEILKAANLRRCSFGFDWSRSGYIHLKRFLGSSTDEFLETVVLNPNIPLCQPTTPDNTNMLTVEPAPIVPMYGFPYFYNPHRDLYDPSTVTYFRRAFQRMRTVIDDLTVHKVYILSDYTNKHAYTFFNEPIEVLRKVTRLIETRGKDHVLMVRVSINNSLEAPHIISEDYSTSSKLVICQTPEVYDQLELRKFLYRYIGQWIASQYSTLPLWSPSK